MLAKPVKSIPPDLHYEAKWDGFRAIVFRDGDEVVIGSRNEKPLTRYFPEVIEAAKSELPGRCVVDGEIIISTDGHLDFDALLNRIHPADSRVQMLAQTTPASFVAFDLLAIGDDDLMQSPFSKRRERLVEALAKSRHPVYLAPSTTDMKEAERWFIDLEGAGLDGLIAKPPASLYEPNKRTMFKIKHERTADCVVAGFRWHKSGGVVGSLILGLFDDEGKLHHVGVSASFPMKTRAELVETLAPYRLAEGETADHPWAWGSEDDSAEVVARVPGAQTRWSTGKDLSWVPLRLSLVVEVAYDHMQGTRFRHTAQFRRWRPDREPQSCTFDQLERPVTLSLDTFIGGGSTNG